MSHPTLFLSGFSRADEAALRALIEQAQPQLQPHWSLASETDAGTLVIDMDSMYGQMALMKALGSNKTLIAVTEGTRADTPHLLRRPLELDEVVRVLNTAAAESLRSTAEPEFAPVQPSPEPAPTPVAEVAAPAQSVSELPAVAAIAPAEPVATPISTPLDAQAKYKLERWPQIDRSYPKHFRIATLMLKGPGTLAEIAEATGASTDEVTEFVIARLASGHAVKA